MKVTQITSRTTASHVIYSADFVFSKPFGGKKSKLLFWLRFLFFKITNLHEFNKLTFSVSKRIWYKVAKEHVSNENLFDTFFVLALPLAIATQEDLEFDGTVSKDLLKKSKQIEKYYHEIAKREVTITASRSSKKILPQDKIGQFFTLGVDSFYSLCCFKNKEDKTKRNLLYIDGYDLPFYEKKFLEEVHTKIWNVASRMNTQALFVETNLREVTDEIIGWGRYHVSALVAVAMLLNYKKVYISGESFESADWGLRFGVDTMYSSDHLTVQFVAHNVPREKKLEELQKSKYLDLFLENVRVCWENVRLAHIPYNCSSCQKCIKTQLTLLALGIKKMPTFEKVTIASIRKLQLVEHVYEEWKHLYNKLKKVKNIDPDLLVAVEYVLKKPLRT